MSTNTATTHNGHARDLSAEALAKAEGGHSANSVVLQRGSFVAFIDETGHEELVDGHPVYGLGGCAVIAEDLDRVIRQPWRNVRRSVTGSESIPLHAHKFGMTAKPENLAVVSEFFRQMQFFRFAAISSVDTKINAPITNFEVVVKSLMERVRDVARWTNFQEMHLIFESSDRANQLIKDAFQGIVLSDGGKQIPLECYFMPKKINDPALEVADFIVHAAQGQAKRKLKNLEGFGKDFQAVFQSVDRKFASYMEILDVR